MGADVMVSNVAGFSSLAAFWLFVMGNSQRRSRSIEHFGTLIMALCFAAVSIALVLRSVQAARFPIANLYESLLLFAWSILAVFFVLRRTYKRNNLGWTTALTVSTIFLYASWLPATQHEIAPLMPALVSYWRPIHVPPLIVSYGLLTIGGFLAISHLWLSNCRKTAISALTAITICISCTALGTFLPAQQGYLQFWFWLGTVVSLAMIFGSLRIERGSEPSDPRRAETYDDMSQRCITIAFPLLTFGIITGALWANHAWGTYWSFDPKESMSLATWFSYAAYMHLRVKSTMSSQTLSVLAVVGMLLTFITYLGFSFLGFGGLHSYGQVG